MKKIIMVLFLLGLTVPSFAAPVGGPEIAIPEESLYLKREAVKKALDRFDYNMDIKGSVEIDFIGKRKLTSSSEVTNAKIEGQTYMLKFSNNFSDLLEPYVKIGTCDLKVKWNQNANSVSVETEPGFVWAVGAKLKAWEFKDYGIKLTLDAQYRNIDLDVDSVNISSATDKKFEIKEFQIGLVASKRFIAPIGMRDYYIAPYTGLTLSWLDADVSFKGSAGELYSTYNASDENIMGFVLGCDVMPSLLSWYLINFELRLITETAFTIGGTVKF